MNRLVELARAELRKRAVPAHAEPMQRYMKTTMPFLGVKKPARAEALRVVLREFPIAGHSHYEAAVRALWELPHREEKYLAIELAARCKKLIGAKHLPLYQQLIEEGAWWDLVDPVVGGCVSPIYLAERGAVRPVIHAWFESHNMWLRRAAILAQLKHRQNTNAAELFSFCRRAAHEKEFFIRKAIGWALRQYAHHNPAAVREFLAQHGHELSALSRREASKHL